MCIIFLWRQETRELHGKFKLILAANRDEFFHRPASHAQYWKENPNVLGGQDLTIGYEGGTWLGVTKTGKLSCITNLRTNNPSDNSRQGRGMLVSNFLMNGLSGKSYLQDTEQEKFLYRPFNLFAGNMLEDLFYTNNIDNSPVEQLDKGFTCLTNGALNCGWMKVKNGLKTFEDVVKKNLCKDDLINNLLNVLEDKTINFPDPAIHVELYPDYLTSTFVPMTMDTHYGTRTNTIILLDSNNIVTFIERTMVKACDPPSQWLTNDYEIKLTDMSD